MAGQVGVADHINVGAQTVLGAQSGVTGHIPAGSNYFGYPAGPVHEQRRMIANLRKLPELREEVKRIKKHLGLEGG
jgi:UDP-3-O-[3-hydroxymyristoyl] glucosamine N-acyltransferase